ncbi:MAG: 1-deoxy-D-xylulose-5-phosphate reductoisomerase [Synergistaceae bacterium]|jgi:1-deoxy-D-xylulose-5-phosphate reductoisomerase|nr:1-deoxy-D-xylulose-5-phosphate reductoisomerase [Synergistaceae bacterium]
MSEDRTRAETARKRVALVGATGSVGSSVLDVCRRHPDRVRVAALAAGKDAEKLASLSREFGPETLCMAGAEAAAALGRLALTPPEESSAPPSVLFGADGLDRIARDPEIDHVVFASSGTAAIGALQAALESGKEVSLANKESIVVAGAWVMPLVRGSGQLRPLDSEHNAVWQCLQGEAGKPRKIYLTASGGPFRDWSFEALETVTPEMALKHPVWNMGAKISIDSATLMNKGIELLEAAVLFGLEPSQVEALVSPGSFVHGLVEFEDGCVKMLAGEPDMRLPAASCLFWPERLPPSGAGPFETPRFRPELSGRRVSFDMADERRFPALRIAKEALRKGGACPALLVGADEVAVESFMKKEISFTAISEVVEETMAAYSGAAPRSLRGALDILEWARTRCAQICRSRR